ncbi:FAD-binding protein [Aquamicrobium lusatiense]|uniref:FAD-binding protein n=1 Tax=Aquamicrobium lusatiense TaxID=89772 RepID=UPI002453EA76|nr:FAD-binding protein [Aquamicrobium lusatiense]MDH4989337.1 FAD-binding protein [Aquamicrobium lusatiense]
MVEVITATDYLELETDVLVIGGGPAGTWAALSARQTGARVILVDKGYCGTSGVGAAATIGHWWVQPENREAAMDAKNIDACGLAERRWMSRVMEETWQTWPDFAESRGYIGDPTYRGSGHHQVVIQGPVYLREMRRLIHRAGVTIMDHAPALSLLSDSASHCVGAEGVLRQEGRHWRIRAGAVVMAAGGCALKSGCIGSSVNTGDALLMAAELGARFSGMEFSNYYGIVPKGGTVDKNGYLLQAAFFDRSGRQVHLGWSSPYGVMGTGAASLFDHEPVYCQFNQVPAERRPLMRAGQPNLFVQFDRLGIDPFAMKFEVQPVFEGSIRGSGGILVEDDSCATAVPGLWVAGDAASREMLVGASSGAGSVNASWTIASGRWAGAAAAKSAEQSGSRTNTATAPHRRSGRDVATIRRLLGALQADVLPISRNGFRRADRLNETIALTRDLGENLKLGKFAEDVRSLQAAREMESMLFFAERSAQASLLRRESRGVHRRADFPDQSPEAWRHLQVWKGLEEGTERRIPKF